MVESQWQRQLDLEPDEMGFRGTGITHLLPWEVGRTVSMNPVWDSPCTEPRLAVQLTKAYAERNVAMMAAVSSGFSSGKKWPPFIACPSARGAHWRQIPKGPPSFP